MRRALARGYQWSDPVVRPSLAINLRFALGRLPGRAPRWLAELPATAIGSLGVFWILQRSTHWLLG